MVQENSNFGAIKFLSGILKEVGIPGFFVVFTAFIFLFWGSAEQKRIFIDKFLLLNSPDPLPCFLVVLFLITIIILSSIYFSRMNKLRRIENNRIGEEKSKLQELLIGKHLNSSK